MWPVAAALTRWLQARFRAREEDDVYVIECIEKMSALPRARRTKARRVTLMTRCWRCRRWRWKPWDRKWRASARWRGGAVARRMLRAALNSHDARVLSADQAVVQRLAGSAATFVERVNRGAMTADSSEQLARVLRSLRYHENCAEQAGLAARLDGRASFGPELAQATAHFMREGMTLIERIEAGADSEPPPELLVDMEQAYALLKDRLLVAGASGHLRLPAMEQSLRRYSALRRALQQTAKAGRDAGRGPASTSPAEPTVETGIGADD